MGSNIIDITPDMAIISPLMRHNWIGTRKRAAYLQDTFSRTPRVHDYEAGGNRTVCLV